MLVNNLSNWNKILIYKNNMSRINLKLKNQLEKGRISSFHYCMAVIKQLIKGSLDNNNRNSRQINQLKRIIRE